MNLSLVYFPSAVALGALHALEPGHAKTLTAAYLIGIKGTKRDAVLLGLAVAFTHSIVVVALCVAALWLGREAFTDRATYWLQLGSGVVVILLGCWLVYRRWPRTRLPADVSRHAHDHRHAVHDHHHAPDPFRFQGSLGSGLLEVADTGDGERFRMTLSTPAHVKAASVHVLRPHNVVEHVRLIRRESLGAGVWMSEVAPQEPHEFDALLEIETAERCEEMPFRMVEPHSHEHDHPHDHGHEEHADLDEQAHIRAHAATLPDYVYRGERPAAWQILAFGAAGGMIPCPAAVTVMLLAISVSETGMGLLMVLGFSVGLAITLVGIGLAVVMGLNALGSTGRFAWLSRRAPLVSAAVVIVSGAVGLAVALAGNH